MRVVTMVAAVVMLAGCSEDAPPAPKSIGFTGEPALAADVDLVNAALKEFTTACPGLFAHPDDIAEARVTYDDPAMTYTGETLGWTKSLQLVVTVVEKPRKLPVSASGHNLWYRLGAGRLPGITSSKDISGDICGFPLTNPGSDRFVPRPALNLLMDLKAG